MKTAILGAGAMGSLVGAHIKKGGGEVHFVDIFEEHMKAIRENGVIMDLLDQPEPITVFVDSAVTEATEVGACDLVIVLVKCVDIETAIESNQALFTEDTAVLALQNGVGSVDILAKYFAEEQLGFGVLKCFANVTGPGRIFGNTCFKSSPIGIYYSPVKLDSRLRPVFEEMEQLLTEGGMLTKFSEDTERFIWDKLCNNVMTNGIAALTQIANEDIQNHPDGWVILGELARELCEVAHAKGIEIDLSKHWKEREEGYVYDRDKVEAFHYVSALFDSVQKRKTEIDFINGVIVREGEKHGIPTPYNETVWRLVRLMQDNYENKYQPKDTV
ncbi:MAG: 2-dehydropantoate 2-reductase [Coriobacteriia bacterium]|nr:2-dehydropantoate 2-reductase [Coriobacteriia bacterium]